jgi:serpin B
LPEPEYISTLALENNDKVINDGINDFSIKYFASVSKNADVVFDKKVADTGNISTSPLGVALCLALQANATDDDSTQKILKLFGASSLDEYNSFCQRLMRFLPFRYEFDGEFDLFFANSAWLSNEFSFADTFKSQLNNYFNAELYSVDFNDKNLQNVMNLWCAAKTKYKITESPITITGQEVIVFLNSIYFNSNWAEPFAASNTAQKTFYGTNGDETADMMHKNDVNFFYSTDTYSAVRLQYDASSYEMVVVMPNEGIDVIDFTNNFDIASLNDITSKSYYAKVSLYLPKFGVEQDLDIKSVLEKMGYPAFQALTKAGIRATASTKVRQKTYVDVQEKGTIAAAVTGIGTITSTGSEVDPEYEQVTMNVNRPFIYFVRNTYTGSILMAGRICNL